MFIIFYLLNEVNNKYILKIYLQIQGIQIIIIKRFMSFTI